MYSRIRRGLNLINQLGNALVLLILTVGLIWLVGAAIGVTAYVNMNGK